MPERIPLSEFRLRANQVRLIAEGLFDKTERNLVLLFVDDCEKRFAIRERSTVGGHDAAAESDVAEHANGGG
jgi:hypothetical protein